MRKIILLLTIFISTSLYASEPDYGLHFRSHKYLGAERTSLLLNNDKPFKLNKEITLSFDISLRNELIFGTVFKIEISLKHGKKICLHTHNNSFRTYFF